MIRACFSRTFARLPRVSCRITAAGAEKEKVRVCLATLLLVCKRSLSCDAGFVVTLRARAMLGFQGDGGVKRAQWPGFTVCVAILSRVFVFRAFRQTRLTSGNCTKSIHPHSVHSHKLRPSLRSPSGLFEFFQNRDGKVKGHRQRGSQFLIAQLRIQHWSQEMCSYTFGWLLPILHEKHLKPFCLGW